MPQLVSPYKDIEQYTVVSLEPYQMNSDIAINTKINLKNKVENKCNKYGFIVKVHKILETGEGNLPAENFSGNAIYNIKYHAKVCIPVNNTYIIGKIIVSNKKLIVATNGPIRIFIPKNNTNTNKWYLLLLSVLYTKILTPTTTTTTQQQQQFIIIIINIIN